jgi:pimeloyl-ACP methyl ester carboxylesterase
MSEIVLDGRRVYYEAPRGLPADTVFLHGFGGSSRQYRPLIAGLGDAVVPVAFDMPGCGGSGGELMPGVREASRFVVDVVDELCGTERQVSLVGHSFGGLLAANVASLLGDRVRALVLIASAPRIRLHPRMIEQAISGQWDPEFLRGSFGPNASEEHVRWVIDDFANLRVGADVDLETNWSSQDISSALPAVSAPTLVLVPEDDAVVSPRRAQSWVREIKHAECSSVAGSGHYLQLEQSAVVAERVGRFFQRALASDSRSWIRERVASPDSAAAVP